MDAWNCLNPTLLVQFRGRDYSLVWFGGFSFFKIFLRKRTWLISSQDPAAESETLLFQLCAKARATLHLSFRDKVCPQKMYYFRTHIYQVLHTFHWINEIWDPTIRCGLSKNRCGPPWDKMRWKRIKFYLIFVYQVLWEVWKIEEKLPR